MRKMAVASLFLVLAIIIGFHSPAKSHPAFHPLGIKILKTSPTHVVAEVVGHVAKGDLVRIAYDDGVRNFVWQNVPITQGHRVILKDDKYLAPSDRLACRSDETTFVIFDDVTKGFIHERGDGTSYRNTYGVPVQSFGGPGYTASYGHTLLKRDVRGNFWASDLFLRSIDKYNKRFEFQFSILFDDNVLLTDFDTDSQDNLFVKYDIWSEDLSVLIGQRIAKYSNNGALLQTWELPRGIRAGEFSYAAGIVVDKKAGYMYVTDDELHRVQRFTLDLQVQPFTFNSWGWIGLEDLSFIHEEFYTPENYGRLDRPFALALDGEGNIYINSHHFISKFSLTTGQQLTYGTHPVLGWGGTFPVEESSHSFWAARDGHWEWQWLAGIDKHGNIYVTDWSNSYVPFYRIQKFDKNGNFLAKWDYLSGVVDQSGNPVYLSGAFTIAMKSAHDESQSDEEDGEPLESKGVDLVVWEAGGRFYKSKNFRSGGSLYLGPGRPGCQFDLTQLDERHFTIEKQTSPIYKTVTGTLKTFSSFDGNGVPYTFNVEAETNRVIPHGMTSLWMPVRLGEPFRVTLFENDIEIPASDYTLYVETQPGTFGTIYDYFRVINDSDRTWTDVTFMATTQPEP